MLPSVCVLAALATSLSAMSSASAGERGSSRVRPITNTRIRVSSSRNASVIMWRMRLCDVGGCDVGGCGVGRCDVRGCGVGRSEGCCQHTSKKFRKNKKNCHKFPVAVYTTPHWFHSHNSLGMRLNLHRHTQISSQAPVAFIACCTYKFMKNYSFSSLSAGSSINRKRLCPTFVNASRMKLHITAERLYKIYCQTGRRMKLQQKGFTRFIVRQVDE